MSEEKNPHGIKVGQVLYRRGVNVDRNRTYSSAERPMEVTVTKVGRSLLTVDAGGGRGETYRLDDLVRNDNYQHEYLQTVEAFEEEVRRRNLTVWARGELGIEAGAPIFDSYTRLPWHVQEAMLRAGVEAAKSGAPKSSGRPAALVDYDSADDMERLSDIWHAQEAAELGDDMRLSVDGWRLRQTLREFANRAGGRR